MRPLGYQLGLGALLAGLVTTAGPGSVAFGQEHDTSKGASPEAAAQILGIDLRDATRRPSQAQIKAAKTIAADLVCLCGTCPREALESCQCPWAQKGRKTITYALMDGKTKDEILKAYETAYDLKVFGLPPDTGLGRMSYIVPYVAATAGLIAFFVFGIRLRRRSAAALATVPAVDVDRPATDQSDEASRILAKELEELD